jgi:hypothetical protein
MEDAEASYRKRARQAGLLPTPPTNTFCLGAVEKVAVMKAAPSIGLMIESLVPPLLPIRDTETRQKVMGSNPYIFVMIYFIIPSAK